MGLRSSAADPFGAAHVTTETWKDGNLHRLYLLVDLCWIKASSYEQEVWRRVTGEPKSSKGRNVIY